MNAASILSNGNAVFVIPFIEDSDGRWAAYGPIVRLDFPLDFERLYSETLSAFRLSDARRDESHESLPQRVHPPEMRAVLGVRNDNQLVRDYRMIWLTEDGGEIKIVPTKQEKDRSRLYHNFEPAKQQKVPVNSSDGFRKIMSGMLNISLVA